MSQAELVLLFAVLAAHGQQAPIEQQEQAQAEQVDQAEINCLGQALYYEARGEGIKGQEAVAEVILQRAKSGRHPDTVCGVVHEPHQFSYLYDGSLKRKRDEKAWKAANDLAERIIRGEIVTNYTRSAMFYHATYVRPRWASAMTRSAQVGNHVFYQQRSQRS
jgi:spore germination cell wall hydrolase CwlJ-like protein